MTANEIIEQSKEVAEELAKNLLDKSIPLNKRQVYFMDNHGKTQQCMKALQNIIDVIKNNPESVSDEEIQAMNDSKAILDSIQKSVAELQQELMINEDVQEEDLSTPGITQESIQDAMENNITTKDIMKDMNQIASSDPSYISYTHCLVCDNCCNFFAANSKQELNDRINDITSAVEYNQVSLFKVSFIPVPLKKKTILSV